MYLDLKVKTPKETAIDLSPILGDWSGHIEEVEEFLRCYEQKIRNQQTEKVCKLCAEAIGNVDLGTYKTGRVPMFQRRAQAAIFKTMEAEQNTTS